MYLYKGQEIAIREGEKEFSLLENKSEFIEWILEFAKAVIEFNKEINNAESQIEVDAAIEKKNRINFEKYPKTLVKFARVKSDLFYNGKLSCKLKGK